MTSTIRTAVLAIAAAFAIAVPVRAAAPAAVARIEVRGLDAFFGAVDRIAAPYAPAGQAKGMLTGMGTASAGVNPFELIDGAGTVRVVVYGVEGDLDTLLDFPAAGGDVAGVLGKLEGTLPAAEVPEGVVLPEGALSLGNDSVASTICIPRGERIALVPHSAFAHEIRDVDGALALLDSVPAVAADGVLAVAIDFDAVRTCVSSAGAGSPGAKLRDTLDAAGFPFQSVSIGLGLDDADRFLVDLSVVPGSGTPYAHHAAGIGAPASPLVNAILLPDAVAAVAYHQAYSAFTDDELRGFFSPTGGEALPAGIRDAMADAYVSLIRLLGDDYAFGVFPAEEGAATGSLGMLAFPADPRAALDDLPDCFQKLISGFATAFAGSDDGEGDTEEDDGDGNLFRIQPTGDRTVQGIPVRSYVLSVEDPEEGGTHEIGAFDAAAVGPALYIGMLPEDRLAGVLGDLASGTTANGPLPAMPAFKEAYGEAPADAACGFVRLRPVLRVLLSRMETFAQTVGDHGFDYNHDALGAFAAFADPALPDLTVATVQRWIPDGGRFENVFSMPLADIHSIADSVIEARRRAYSQSLGEHPGESGGEEDEEDGYDGEDE